jgi:hypothetical protein
MGAFQFLHNSLGGTTCILARKGKTLASGKQQVAQGSLQARNNGNLQTNKRRLEEPRLQTKGNARRKIVFNVFWFLIF